MTPASPEFREHTITTRQKRPVMPGDIHQATFIHIMRAQRYRCAQCEFGLPRNPVIVDGKIVILCPHCTQDRQTA